VREGGVRGRDRITDSRELYRMMQSVENRFSDSVLPSDSLLGSDRKLNDCYMPPNIF
jgi:hypothetical protein